MYAPELAEANSGFDPEHFAELAPVEAGNFWFRVRNSLILWALGKYCRNFSSLMEIGCGTGYVLSGVAARYPGATLHGSEIFTAGLAVARARLPAIEFMQMDARRIPFVEEFDVMGAFDVLEHIEDDRAVLRQMFEALKPGGTVLLTVPQHAWLWSPVDDRACHVRRYAARDLEDKLREAGFKVARSTSFVSTLLPLMYVSRLFKRSATTGADAMSDAAELRLPRWLNATFEAMLSIDFLLIRAGIDLKWGGSRLVVGKKT
ncbi:MULTISPECIES: class I SAM-dependent methyltransferase [unclassified Cupriavidus]|uniref:class I SAM-dependent methyltransferase n=1 Tax=unclassified Cupriavidus TaxID=2640874 RepID=UPI001BFFEAC9|nr:MULTISPECIES: class I SAM-dependent methyltransferase [unclassified Cupriavidus]QWE93847.1 class I SAM-dependent methyltransferase [Cupriavidus sp. EM10]